MFITVERGNRFGNEVIKPLDELAQRFATLLGVKEFNARQIAGIKAIGFEVRTAATASVSL
jgi:hypothetical protein